jgi:hypothetical protein
MSKFICGGKFMLPLMLSSMMALNGVFRIDDGTFGDFGLDLDGEPKDFSNH